MMDKERRCEEGAEKRPDTGLACFLVLMQLMHISITKEQIDHVRRFETENSDLKSLLLLAREVKCKGKIRNASVEQLSELLQPVIALCRDGTYFVLGRIDTKEDGSKRVMVLLPQDRAPKYLTLEEFRNLYAGMILIIAKKGFIDEEAAFGFKWFLSSVLKFKRDFVTVFLAIFVLQIIGILTPLMTQVVVDKVLVHRTVSTLWILTIALFISYVFELILNIARTYVFTHTTNRIDVTISWRLFKHLFSLPLRYFESRKVGETVARIRETENIRSFLTGTPLSSILDAIFIIVYIVVLFFYSVPLTFVVIASIPVFVILSLVVNPLFKKRLDEKFYAGSEAQSFLVESITGVQTVKSFALEPKLLEDWGKHQADYVKAGYRTAIVAGNSNAVGQFIQKTFDLLILFLGAKAVMEGQFSVGQLVAYRMLSGRVSGPVLRFVQLWQEYSQASLSVKRIGDIFTTVPEPGIQTGKMQLPEIKGNVEFEHVSFRYRLDAPQAVSDMSFSIPAGTVVGICGRSGSGKSTITKLVQRLYVPESGKILIDGMDISMADPSELRTKIGIVLQDNFMFSGTVADNIRIHCPGANMNQVVAAAKLAGAHDFILGLTNGYDTLIGEKGTGLSGGQKQRIAIARAIIHNPRILIFDEATSALDYESESIIMKNLHQICKGRTVLIIAHRLSTIEHADKIMVVDGGRIAEYGTKEELISSDGIYQHLRELQERGEVC